MRREHLLRLAAVLLGIVSGGAARAVFADQPDTTRYELQVIHAKPGKLDEVHAWFRAHQQDVLAKHGAENMSYLVPVGANPENTILAVYKFPSLPAVLAFGRAIKADPLWKAFDTSTDTPELLVAKVDIMGLTPTDYSPDFKPEKAIQPRVFELRTYTCPSPEKLAALHDRFRSHTVKLFAKHGMENLVYWQPRDIEDSDRKLVYLLGHKSQDAAKESFAAFRKDPDWLAAKEASEKAAGGSLTNAENGVVSEFFVATDYSPLK
jgi:hypothetical protein